MEEIVLNRNFFIGVKTGNLGLNTTADCMDRISHFCGKAIHGAD